MRYHMWKVERQILPTNYLRCRRHMALDDLCPLWLDHAETVIHSIRDCKWVKQVWNLLPVSNILSFFQTDLTNWLKLNLSSRFVIGGIAWSQYFGVNTLDHLWWALERLYFQPEMDSYEWSCGYGASYGSWDPKKPTKSTCTSFAKHGLSLSRDVCYFYSLPFLLCNPLWRRLM